MSSPTLPLPPLRVAVIGVGLIGRRHCTHILSSPMTALAAIVDPSPQASTVAVQYPSVPLYPTISALLGDPHMPHPDAAIICTPNALHVTSALPLAQSGVHILCEKPLSDSIPAGLALIAACRSHNVRLLVGHHRR